jgi:hypothetical protein
MELECSLGVVVRELSVINGSNCVYREHCMDIGVSILLFEVSENMGSF